MIMNLIATVPLYRNYDDNDFGSNYYYLTFEVGSQRWCVGIRTYTWHMFFCIWYFAKFSFLVSLSSAIIQYIIQFVNCMQKGIHLWSSGNTGSLVGDGVEHLDGVGSGPLVVVVPDHLVIIIWSDVLIFLTG